MHRTLALIVAWSVTAHAQPSGPAPVAPAALPPLPSFELPASEPGFASVRELQARRAQFLDTEVKAQGYVIWIYDCVTAIAAPREPRARTQKRIDRDPTLCERPKFYLGHGPKDAPERGLWVVDVPRPPNRLEKERLPQEELRAWPKVPAVKLGTYVTVTGQFTLRSPHNEANSDGLIVFQSIAPAKVVKPAKHAAIAVPARPTVPTPTPMKRAIAPKNAAAEQRSINLSNEGTRAYGAKSFDEAITTYTKSIAEWPDNHVAWYGLAGSHIGRKNWRSARDAMAEAIAIRPAEAMYQMVYGYVLYELAIETSRVAVAKKLGKRPDEVEPDPTAINFDEMVAHLTYAATLDPQQWRAHYYLGRIHRDRGEDRWAAESLDAALRAGAAEPNPWIALGELYRKWGYANEAIAVMTAGTSLVPGAADLWYVLGLAYDDKRQDARALDAFSHALAITKDHPKALFQRGQVYYRKKAAAKARADLEAFMTFPGNDFAKAQANKMLTELGSK